MVVAGNFLSYRILGDTRKFIAAKTRDWVVSLDISFLPSFIQRIQRKIGSRLILEVFSILFIVSADWGSVPLWVFIFYNPSFPIVGERKIATEKLSRAYGGGDTIDVLADLCSHFIPWLPLILLLGSCVCFFSSSDRSLFWVVGAWCVWFPFTVDFIFLLGAFSSLFTLFYFVCTLCTF